MELLKQSADRRRDLIRHLYYTGLSVSLILERLNKHDSLFPITADYDERYSIVASDIAKIRKEAIEAVNIDEYEIKEKHAEYIIRQEFLYHLAIQDGNLALARVISLDLGRAFGVEVDEVMTVKTDLLGLLRNAQAGAAKKLQERKAIDVTPQETIPDAIRPQADAIFHKR